MTAFEAILDEVNRAFRMMVFYERMLADDDDGLTQRLYSDARRHVTEVATLAVRAGIREPQLESAESAARAALNALAKFAGDPDA